MLLGLSAVGGLISKEVNKVLKSLNIAEKYDLVLCYRISDLSIMFYSDNFFSNHCLSLSDFYGNC